ncbi:MAG: AAA family ATPase [Chloroflexota bacterium]|nr:AAA family ATPase [Chloroflexota bacterium]
MTIIKQAPNQPILDPGKFDWEQEETTVDRRQRFSHRLSRFMRSIWVWGLIISLAAVALFDPNIMNAVVQVAGLGLQIGLLIGIFLSQFILMFWFLSRTRQYTIMPGAEGVSFDDYRGQPEVLEQAHQIVTLLRGVRAFEAAGGEPLNGLLLEGPPGTGKTWLAQAISTEAGVPYFYVDTSSLQAMFMGMGSMKVMRMYAKARKAAKWYGAAVIFLDEIDSIGSRSGVSSTTGAMGTPPGARGFFGGGDMGLLSTMLIEMSGFNLEHGWRAKMRTRFYKLFLRRNPPKPQKRVLTIGATNRIGALDPALLRPGRFDKKIRIDAPDTAGRRDIFSYYLTKMAHDETIKPVVLATETPGYTPADIKYLLNETLRYALFSGRRYMNYEDFQRAKPEHEMGLRTPLKHITREAMERIATYQAGKAVAIRLFTPGYRISRISIVRQGAAYGHVAYYSAQDKYMGMQTKDDYLKMLRVFAGGKAAEIEFCGAEYQSVGVMFGMTKNPLGDFGMIRTYLRAMALAGMFGHLGASVTWKIDVTGAELPPTPEMAKVMEETFQDVLRETRKALRANAPIVKALVALLMEKQEVSSDAIAAFFDMHGLHTPEATMIVKGEVVRMLPEVTYTAQS